MGMSKDKEWLKEEIGELPCVDAVFNIDGSSYIDSVVPVMDVYDLIDQLDEPEKPVIPQFVAKFIERHRARTDLEMWHVVDWLASDDYEESEELTVWYRENSTTFARAWLDGYTVEKETHPILKAFDEKVKEYESYGSTSMRMAEVRKVLVEAFEEEEE